MAYRTDETVVLGFFLIQIASYAVLSNHFHLVIYVDTEAALTVQALAIPRHLNQRIRRKKPTQLRVVDPSVHMNQSHAIQMFMAVVAAVRTKRHDRPIAVPGTVQFPASRSGADQTHRNSSV